MKKLVMKSKAGTVEVYDGANGLFVTDEQKQRERESIKQIIGSASYARAKDK